MMRERKEIESELHRPIAISQRMDNLKVELLLDIRDLLIALRADLALEEIVKDIQKQQINPRKLKKL